MENYPPETVKMYVRWLRWAAAVVVLVGAVPLGVGVRDYVKGRASQTWPSVDGKVMSSELETRLGGAGEQTSNRARIQYAYTVDGQSYTSRRVGFGVYGSSDSIEHERLMDTYSEGKTVRVHVNPANPQDAVLIVGPSPDYWFLPLIGLAFVLVGVVMFSVCPAVKRLLLYGPPDPPR